MTASSVSPPPESPSPSSRPGDAPGRLARLLDRITNPLAAAIGYVERVPFKTISALLILILLISYAIEGAGRTVIATLRLPAGSEAQLGTDASTLTYDLIVEMGRIRTVQDTARRLRFNLVKGLESQGAGRRTLDLDMSVQINADYKGLIDHLGTVKLEWGAIQVPVEMLMRPIQRLLRQRVLEVVVERDGDQWRASCTADDGRFWEASTRESTLLDTGDSCTPLQCVLQALAYKMAFVGGQQYEPSDSWLGFRDFHRGVRDLLGYDLRGATDFAGAVALLDNARDHFQRAVAVNPSHRESRYNLLLTSLERASFIPLEDRGSEYENLIVQIKDLLAVERPPTSGTRELLTAAYVLQAEAALARGQPDVAATAYKAALVLLPQDVDLRVYVLNNLGQLSRDHDEAEEASRWFRAAIAQDPGYMRAQMNLGNLAFDSGDFAAAEGVYVGVLSKQPAYAGALYNLGLLYLNLADSGALDQLTESTRKCLQRQATEAMSAYIANLDYEEITRNLSSSDKNDVLAARAQLTQILSDAPEGPTPTAAWTYRRCLGAS